MQGHSPAERKTVGGKQNVAILEVMPIGNYAVRLVFDDMHSTGIFSWDYLLELGRNREENWQDVSGRARWQGTHADAVGWIARSETHRRLTTGPP